MNKRDFATYIKERLEGMSLERQIQELEKVQTQYIPELINNRKKKLGLWIEPEKKGEYFRCEKCHKYSPLKKVKKDFVNEIREEYTYRDAGYGDDDRIGEVLYKVEYVTCPKCGHRQETNKFYMKLLRDWNARSGR